MFLEKESSKKRAALHGGRERAVVEIVELAADGDAVRKARHLHAGRGERVHQVVRRRLAFDSCVHREDNFVDAVLYAAKKAGDVSLSLRSITDLQGPTGATPTGRVYRDGLTQSGSGDGIRIFRYGVEAPPASPQG